MTKRRKKKRWDGILHLGNFEINLNSVLTTVFGSIVCLLLTAAIMRLGTLTKNWKYIYENFPQVQNDLAEIKKEQNRFKVQYAPPVPSPTP